MLRATTFVVACAFLLIACTTQPVAPVAVETEKQFASVQVSSTVSGQFDEALAALQQNDYDRAVKLLNEVIAVEKRLAAPFVNLGMAYARKGDDAHAEEYLRKAVEIDLGHPVANNELGMLYRKLGRFDDAHHAYSNALAQQADYLPAIRNLGILCELYLRDLDCAMQQYERLLEFVPDDKTINLWIADIRRRSGR